MLNRLKLGKFAAHPRVLPVLPVILTLALILSLWLRSLSPLQADASSTALFDPAAVSLADSAIELNELAWRTGLPASQFRLTYKHQPRVELPDELPIEESKEALLKLIVAPSGQIIRVEVVNSSGLPQLDQALLQGFSSAAFQPLHLPGNPVAVISYQPFSIAPADSPEPLLASEDAALAKP